MWLAIAIMIEAIAVATTVLERTTRLRGRGSRDREAFALGQMAGCTDRHAAAPNSAMAPQLPTLLPINIVPVAEK
jgi:hypothetical protein